MLTSITNGLWEVHTPIKFAGVKMPSRTTIVELSSGGLFVNSPGRLDAELGEALDKLGPVRAVVAPNRFHHLFINDWRTAYPDAAVAVAPGLDKKRKDLADIAHLGNAGDAVWSSDLEQHFVNGIPAFNETVFCHKPSRTLICTDLAFNMREDPSAFARFIWRMMGAWNKFGPSRMERLLCRDKAALGASLTAILAWDFDRVVVGHGDVLESGGKDGLATGYAWALSAR